ncbi:MAG: hypothetical protein IPK19_03855 [Chloroflexi bacterium]|nr:hypothetical protein [Chloroflexota bacterium]
MSRNALKMAAYRLLWITLAGLILHFALGLTSVGGNVVEWLPRSVLMTAAIAVGLSAGSLYLLGATAPTARPDRLTRWAILAAAASIVSVTVSMFSVLGGRESVAPFHLTLVLPVSVLPLLYWLYRRFGNVSTAWAESSLAAAVLLLVVSRGLRVLLVALPPDFETVPPTLRTLVALFSLACALIVGAHGMAPHADRGTDRLLSAPWAAAALLWLVLAACLETLLPLPGMASWACGPLLEEARVAAVQWAGLALVLGLANQVAAELRGENRRVTGWIPFWLVLAGSLLHAAGRVIAGLLSAYHAALPGAPPMAEGQTLLAPFAGMAQTGVVLILVGLLVFAVSYYWRRPRSTA